MSADDQFSMFYGASPITFEKAKMLRANTTEPENILWNQLSNKIDGFKFRRQHPIGVYVADFYCHKARLVIEIDGKNHRLSQQIENDKIRDEEMINLGIRVIRFTNEEVISDPNKVVEVIKKELKLD